MEKDTVVLSVIGSFQERSRAGQLKYGTTLDRTDLTPQQWAQHMLNERTETSSAENAWQNLVIDRGSVKVSDVIMYNP